MSDTLPQINIHIQPDEYDMLMALASTNKLPRTGMARALFRAGLAVFNQAPEEIVALADRRVRA